MAGLSEIFEKYCQQSALIGIVLIYIVTCIFTYFAFIWRKVKIPKFPRKILLITAHPDDECMFFSPTVQAETSKGNFVYVLCLSKGDYYKIGDKRTKELIKSCSVLGIPERNIRQVDHAKLPDSPSIDWDAEVLEKEIIAIIYGLQPNKVITFDSNGVSGHINHTALYNCIQDICGKNRMPRHTRVFVLKTTSILRKYLSILDLPLAYLISKRTFVSTPLQTFYAWRAMFAHRSQLM
ncbi:N-acetylglucosaminyl-phosphatidylinositol de-N-acetylase-like isoform X14 [Mytilus californianus]|nr:N-acetylglucosaminyl-phosphatidylinositol de-N-acetylase-like isoform X2 [Mytilus californianus]XP_052103302.1 N-acetylglucosaminyl-phosphatidylinositol de-N-acetylase-like isoform X3 [Mytilus californianus]XP_052103303.1 N-acetylglucosaminyl-phosphatidylinositol de-N-acetylase-like isoform X4 [Mytilus californianus]XP_052103304.1 N-acetylglucosaminyl-phosphatidylinositol de-N-acetylase-like isoform X5 [Mytilus californianus]XP_052103305.1 N-acetylglucosaminyl-phosphatidylinositol de-N-acety